MQHSHPDLNAIQAVAHPRFAVRALLGLLAAFAVTGCYTTEFNPATPVAVADTNSDSADSGLADAAVDTALDTAAEITGDAVTSELSDSATEIAAADGIDAGDELGDVDAALDATTTADADDAAAETDVGPALLAAGHTCTADDQCETAICLTVTGSPKICSKACTGECPAGLRCGLDLATGSTSVPYCLPLPSDLCKPCELDTDCSGGACVPLSASKESLCGVTCGPGGTCPTGFVCQSFLAGEVCVPQLGTCTCSDAMVDQGWACEVSNPKVGKCLGVQNCTATGWALCSAAMPIPELCDGQDNNCNGLTDESYTALGTLCGIGQCAGGKFICSTDKKTVVCSTEVKKPAKDLCNNGLDDNCNGQTDEGCPPKDTDNDGSPDLQDCAPYLAEIHPGALEGCCLALPPVITPTATDVSIKTKGCDLNCDGKVVPCTTLDSDGDSFVPPEDCNNLAPKSYPGAPDKCGDGIDQDCDGSDAVCDLGNDQDGDGWPASSNGVIVDCDDSTNTRFPGAKELCNGIDEDCDGVVDNGNPGGGGSCGASVGACKAGAMVCTVVGLSKAATMLCVDAQGGEPEICNGKDDNCDGLTDETFIDQGLGAKCDTDDSDMCSNGIKACQADAISLTCATESVYDVMETCKSPGVGNGQDEDCDGLTDEACYPADLDGDGAVGTADCNEYDAGYSPKVKVELCCDASSGKTPLQIKACDRNCDGQVAWCDEADLDHDGYTTDDCNPQDATSYPGAPEACGDGIDQDCANGDQDCAGINDEDGDKYANQVDCKPLDKFVNPGVKEICNGKDDDCNGITDDGNPGGGMVCGSNVGTCKTGLSVCTKVTYVAQVLCVPQKSPTPELCNALDDNCNGKTDEYFTDLGKPCDGDDSDSCPNGTFSCSGDGKKTVCVNETVQNLAELCDGIDNDCDGQTDEGLNYFGAPIGGDCKGLGECGKGIVVCSPELQVPVCSTDLYGTIPGGVAETCNGKDDDCDGLTDEDQVFAGKHISEACSGPGACAGVPGKVECGPSGKAICSTMVGGSKFAGKTETCNNIDDDCDGHVDEGLVVADSTCKQTGVCNTGNVVSKCTLGVWQCSYSGVVGYQPDKEYSCDAMDNDCDGQTDEDFLIGLACDGLDSDECPNGTWTCSGDHGDKECVNETVKDIVELCNGKDDNCDGKTDEGFDVGDACDGPDSDACKNGTKQCTSDGKGTVCGKESQTDLQEFCDGIDNDCNTMTDEIFTLGADSLPLGAACDGPDSDQCKNGVVVCATDGGSAVCGTETEADIKESCDGADNNCNGQTDEGQSYLGKAMGAVCTGTGACGVGTVVCSPQTLKATCSTNPDAYLIFNGKELCDGLDNDCNGLTDDNLSYNGVTLGQQCPEVGECKAGVVQCGADKQVVCSTQKGGNSSQVKAEVCDGKDNNCDGQTDEGLAVADSNCKKVGVCVSTKLVAVCQSGAWTCDYGAVDKYEAIEATCDGLDNDCDGLTDEGFDIGKACDGNDTDQCKTGTFSCAPGGGDHQCINEDQQNIQEVCDGKDNDCNGQTDEIFTYGAAAQNLGATCDGVGTCGIGKVVCNAAMTAAVCSTDPEGPSSQAKNEVCDSLDNDCDGLTDNGMKFQGLSIGAPCSGVGECGLGNVVCNSKQQAVCSTNPDGPDHQDKSEVCNAKDDNCDGQTDETSALDPKSSTCNQIGVCAKALVATCSKGSWKCSYNATLGFEAKETLCDDLDNDCNGVTDDPYPTKGKICDGVDADLCKNGIFVCTVAKNDVVCNESDTGSAASAEICDGKDNDCNGQTDELFPTLGQACDGPDSDLCPNGVLICTGDGKTVVCGDEFIQNLVEVCDALDNNCNGQTDEGLGLGTACDGADDDQCKNGTVTCGPTGKTVCENETITGIKEICDNKDNNCDGVTDEGFAQKGQKCDVPTDIDNCATGTYQCTTTGALACIGDVACVGGVPCKYSGSNTVVDQCICNGNQACNVDQGNSCSAAGVCTCSGAAACTLPQKCSGGCK